MNHARFVVSESPEGQIETEKNPVLKEVQGQIMKYLPTFVWLLPKYIWKVIKVKHLVDPLI